MDGGSGIAELLERILSCAHAGRWYRPSGFGHQVGRAHLADGVTMERPGRAGHESVYPGILRLGGGNRPVRPSGAAGQLHPGSRSLTGWAPRCGPHRSLNVATTVRSAEANLGFRRVDGDIDNAGSGRLEGQRNGPPSRRVRGRPEDAGAVRSTAALTKKVKSRRVVMMVGGLTNRRRPGTQPG
jgi:hypothetical protein